MKVLKPFKFSDCAEHVASYSGSYPTGEEPEYEATEHVHAVHSSCYYKVATLYGVNMIGRVIVISEGDLPTQ